MLLPASVQAWCHMCLEICIAERARSQMSDLVQSASPCRAVIPQLISIQSGSCLLPTFDLWRYMGKASQPGCLRQREGLKSCMQLLHAIEQGQGHINLRLVARDYTLYVNYASSAHVAKKPESEGFRQDCSTPGTSFFLQIFQVHSHMSRDAVTC